MQPVVPSHVLAAAVAVTAGLIATGGPLAPAPAAAGAPQATISGLPFRPAVVAGDAIYVSGTLATDARGQLVPGDVGAQTARVLDNIRATLEQAGGSLARVAAVQVYLKRAADFEAMNAVYRTYWPADPPVRTTVVANLVLPEALVEIAVVGLRAGAERTVIHPEGWNRSPSPYSYGIRSGDTLYLAGLVARNPRDNSPVSGDMAAQTKAVLANGGDILRAAGMRYADVVSARVFITDTAAFQDMNAAYRTVFPTDPPARATVRTGLTSPQYLVEIAMTAVRSADRAIVTTPNADGTPGQPNPVLSSAVRAGRRLYLSGMLGTAPEHAGDIGGQTKEALARLGRTLKAAGFDWPHVVDGVVYLTDLANFPGMNTVYRTVVPAPYPARAAVEAGLVAPGGLVEIMLTAQR